MANQPPPPPTKPPSVYQPRPFVDPKKLFKPRGCGVSVFATNPGQDFGSLKRSRLEQSFPYSCLVHLPIPGESFQTWPFLGIHSSNCKGATSFLFPWLTCRGWNKNYCHPSTCISFKVNCFENIWWNWQCWGPCDVLPPPSKKDTSNQLIS